MLALSLLLACSAPASSQEPPPPGEAPSQQEPQTQPQEPPPEAAPPAPPEVEPETVPPPAVQAPELESVPEIPAPPPRQSRPKKPLSGRKKLDDLTRKISALAPKGTYLLIDTGINRLYLMKNQSVVREAVCSTGSGRFLPDPPRNREWTFDTPKGEFRIQKKIVNPVWIKPDWAFIEEGEEIPKKSADRVAPDELGDYAMDLGDGYLIHGTLYERSLGMSVTHGCVRLGAKDLDAIFHTVRIGTPVYIF